MVGQLRKKYSRRRKTAENQNRARGVMGKKSSKYFLLLTFLFLMLINSSTRYCSPKKIMHNLKVRKPNAYEAISVIFSYVINK